MNPINKTIQYQIKNNEASRSQNFYQYQNTIMINFSYGMKVYVRFNSEIAASFGKWLTVDKYENGLLYFKGKTPYEAIDCSAASFYGFGAGLAGSTLVTTKKWQIPFAAAAEKLRYLLPVNNHLNLKSFLPADRSYPQLETNN